MSVQLQEQAAHLVTKPVRALDGVVGMPPPVILAHVAKSSIDAALRSDCVGARGKELGDAPAGEEERLQQALTGQARHNHRNEQQVRYTGLKATAEAFRRTAKQKR